MRYISFDYEVFGKVQGVFFRAYTVDKAKKLGVVGWVQNSKKGTVVGQVQGGPGAADNMKAYLQTEGSPPSRIDRCEIKNEKTVDSLDFDDFTER